MPKTPRIPSSALVRFLLRAFGGDCDLTLAQAKESVEKMTAEDWSQLNTSTKREFPQKQITEDLDLAIKQCGAGNSVSQSARPIVLCVFGSPRDGKSTLSFILDDHGIPQFSTDRFAIRLAEGWSGDDQVTAGSRKRGRREIKGFWLDMEKLGKVNFLLDRFFDSVFGFTIRDEVSVIEGFLPESMQKGLIEKLVEHGYHVWVTQRSTPPPPNSVRKK